MVTTTRAERPSSSLSQRLGPVEARMAKSGRMSCSKNAFTSAGMSPSHSGNTMARWPAQAMVSCAARLARLPVRARAQHREVQPGDVEAADLVPARPRALGVGIGQRVAEAAAGGVGMSLDDDDVHGSLLMLDAVSHGPLIPINRLRP